MKQMTWKDAIYKVLEETVEPLHYKEIAERILSEGLRTTAGATPADTVNSELTRSIKHEGEKSPYVRVSKGLFALKSLGIQPMDQPKSSTPTVVEKEDQYDVITAFGMFWRRASVQWAATPKLLGMQQIGATPVNFHGQLGVYLLYDGRDVIYVGRSTDRPIGRRLYEHTVDRLSARWDRFSWFGLLPVSDEGKVGALPSTFDSTKLIPALEAILIEALEPPQNRRRGDDLAAVEYLQVIDPDVKKKQITSAFQSVLEKL